MLNPRTMNDEELYEMANKFKNVLQRSRMDDFAADVIEDYVRLRKGAGMREAPLPAVKTPRLTKQEKEAFVRYWGYCQAYDDLASRICNGKETLVWQLRIAAYAYAAYNAHGKKTSTSAGGRKSKGKERA